MTEPNRTAGHAPEPPEPPEARIAQLERRAARERDARKAAEGDVDAPWYIKAPFWALCVMLDACFANRCARGAPAWLVGSG